MTWKLAPRGPEEKVWRVSEITRHIKHVLEKQAPLQDTWVRGEIANFKHHSRGHLYFSLRDGESRLACVMFSSRVAGLVFAPANGISVLCRGSIGVFERDGIYQLYVEEMHPDGLGALWQALEELRRRLEGEGLFAPARKRPLPQVPARVAVITSPTGAVIRDIVRVAHRRFPRFDLLLVPVQVQGLEAPGEIAAALDLVNRYRLAEVIIVARGGGSMEELWAFNTEEVARAISRSALPVVSAVGHESDVTIADLVADVRAATPSHAAEIVVPDRARWEEVLSGWRSRLRVAVAGQLARLRERLDELAVRPCLARPADVVWQRRQAVDLLAERLERALGNHLRTRRSKVEACAGQLAALDPRAVLSRGYAICYRLPGRQVVASVDEVAVPDEVVVRLKDGEMDCRVQATRELPGGDGR
ncbi:MAG: exodeoxyribonuclease VII large subunit [Bacillota bacterium]